MYVCQYDSYALLNNRDTVLEMYFQVIMLLCKYQRMFSDKSVWFVSLGYMVCPIVCVLHHQLKWCTVYICTWNA